MYLHIYTQRCITHTHTHRVYSSLTTDIKLVIFDVGSEGRVDQKDFLNSRWQDHHKVEHNEKISRTLVHLLEMLFHFHT